MNSLENREISGRDGSDQPKSWCVVQAERDGSNEFSNYQLGSLNTTDTLEEDLDNYDFIIHNGDLAYANGYISQWDQFIEQVEVLSSRVPYMTTRSSPKLPPPHFHISPSLVWIFYWSCKQPISLSFRVPSYWISLECGREVERRYLSFGEQTNSYDFLVVLLNFSTVKVLGKSSSSVTLSHGAYVKSWTYFVSSGNHERDWPFSGSYYNNSDSGGECGVPAQTLFSMPAKNRANSW